MVYVDIGLAHGRPISEMDEGRNFILFLDHHDAEPVESERAVVANPELFDLSGERDASAHA